MKGLLYFIPILVIFSLPLMSQENSGFGHFGQEISVPCLTTEEHDAIELEVKKSMAELSQLGILSEIKDQTYSTMLNWPVERNNGLDDYGYYSIATQVDHDPGYPNMILDYNCGTRTYDQADGYNHAGTDIRNWPFARYKLVNDQVKVIAAAPGIIVFKRGEDSDQNCGINSNPWNAVHVRHADGSVAWYGHLKNGSLTAKSVGEAVETGEYLGIVGSSGRSITPHLHFEVYDASGSLIDPYEGSCNSLNSQSWWVDQRPYYDSGLNALMTHSAPPVFPPCPETETINEKKQFCSGDLAYFAGYYRDQLDSQLVEYRIFYPGDSIFQQWTQTFIGNLNASYYLFDHTLPDLAPTGRWKFQITYEGDIYEKFFDVIGNTTVTVDENTSFCDSVILEAPESHYGFSYQWANNGIDIPGATFSTYSTAENGEYSCKVSIPNGCSSYSDTLMIELFPSPNLDLGEDTLYIEEEEVVLEPDSAYATYSWSTGVGTSSIIVNTPGIYSLTVTDQNGCTASDQVVVIFIITATKSVQTDGISIYPNPADDYFYVKSEGQALESVRLLDPLGRMIKEIDINNSGCEIWELYVGDIDPGLYFIQIGSIHNRRSGGVMKK